MPQLCWRIFRKSLLQSPSERLALQRQLTGPPQGKPPTTQRAGCPEQSPSFPELPEAPQLCDVVGTARHSSSSSAATTIAIFKEKSSLPHCFNIHSLNLKNIQKIREVKIIALAVLSRPNNEVHGKKRGVNTILICFLNRLAAKPPN